MSSRNRNGYNEFASRFEHSSRDNHSAPDGGEWLGGICLSGKAVQTSLTNLRKLIVHKQRLTGKFPTGGTKEDILSVMRDVAYIQWDPVNVVAPAHIISLWSRIGKFNPSDLEKLLWEDRRVFEHYTPVLMLMLTEEYPIFYSLMKRYPKSLRGSWGSHSEHAQKFLSENRDLQKRILKELEDGPLSLDQLTDYTPSNRSADGWSSDSKVSNMMFHLHMLGKVMIVGHHKNQNVWGLSDDFLPEWVERKLLTENAADRAAATRALKSMGPATLGEINYYFVRGRYHDLERALSGLEKEKEITRLRIEDIGRREERYILSKDIPLLESMDDIDFVPRVSLLSPFDNMISGRNRTSRVFGFEYILEQFVPREKRRYGTYVLPILWGERLIGRIDPRMDREENILKINAVHKEPGADIPIEAIEEIGTRIEELGLFLGADGAKYTSKIPPQWKGRLN